MTSLRVLLRIASFGILIDLGVFCASLLFFGGPHGPAGPFFVFEVLNAPVASAVLSTLPESTSTLVDMLVALGVVALNGALYGLIVGFLVLALRRVRGRVKAGDAASPAPKIDR